MDLKYRIRKRTTVTGEEQYYVDYKRLTNGTNVDEIPWMGGFYAKTKEEAMKIKETHKEYEDLKERLQMTEDVIYDETSEEKE